MKIILTSTVSGLGKVGDVLDVKNGFAKNFLIPTNKAICYSENNKSLFEAKRSEYEKASNDLLDVSNQLKNQFIGKNLIIIENASDDGRLYGSVNSAVIAAKVNEEFKKDAVNKSDIVLTKPIKEIGVYEVSVELHPENVFTIKVVISRLESEVENLLKTYEKQQKLEAKKAAEEAKKEVAADKKEQEPTQEQQEEIAA